MVSTDLIGLFRELNRHHVADGGRSLLRRIEADTGARRLPASLDEPFSLAREELANTRLLLELQLEGQERRLTVPLPAILEMP